VFTRLERFSARCDSKAFRPHGSKGPVPADHKNTPTYMIGEEVCRVLRDFQRALSFDDCCSVDLPSFCCTPKAPVGTQKSATGDNTKT
jgi:hypothetical protein